MIANKLHEKISEAFQTLREDGIIAIANSTNEVTSKRLLGMMQFLTKQEIELKTIISELENEIVINLGNGISEASIAEGGATMTEIKIEQHD